MRQPERPARRSPTGRGGLAWKLILLQMLWMLPALVLADYYVLWEETRRLERGLDEGRLDAVAVEMAANLERGSSDAAQMAIALDRERLLLEQARGGLADGAGYILRELSDAPLALLVERPDGSALAHSGATMTREPPGNDLVRRAEVPLQLTDGPARLIVQVSVPRPSLSLLGPSSFEGNILTMTAFVLALSGGILLSAYLGHRLGKIRRQVQAWRHGELASRIGPSGADELGVLAADLDGMAASLQRLLQDRARLGALEERHRLARDLHDTVKQKAFALGLQLAALRRALPDSPLALAEVERLATEIREELALVVNALRPEQRPGEDFRACLDERARRWQLATGLNLTVNCHPGPEPDPARADQLLRILDEALANVSRHAGPCAARVELYPCSDSQWGLRVTDDGIGFDPTNGNGRGLQHLRERSQDIGGNIRIDSRPGAGSRIEVRFPLAADTTDAPRKIASWRRRTA
jgi:signal transduction histidine kinase